MACYASRRSTLVVSSSAVALELRGLPQHAPANSTSPGIVVTLPYRQVLQHSVTNVGGSLVVIPYH